MDQPSPTMRKLARRLLALEAGPQTGPKKQGHEAVRVCDKLRVALTRLAGQEGFAALLRRSLALARKEVPALGGVAVNPECSIEGLEELVAESTCDATEAANAITANLLGLLVTFIGEALTLQIVREGWPDAALDEHATPTEAE